MELLSCADDQPDHCASQDAIAERLVERLGEKGIMVHCVAKADDEQAIYFYDELEVDYLFGHLAKFACGSGRVLTAIPPLCVEPSQSYGGERPEFTWMSLVLRHL